VDADLTGETGIHEAGLDEVLRALTGPAEPAELAGENSAVAMFRASVRPSAGVIADDGPVAGRAATPGRFATRPLRKPVRWSPRLVLAAAVVLCGGMAAAAYTAVLPEPAQHLAHDVFQFAGVPDSQAGSARSGSSHGASAGHRPGAPANPGGPAPSGGVPSTGAVGPSVAPGAAVLSAAADPTQITAGTGVLITAQLSWPGHAVGGLTMTVLEQQALTPAWHVVGSAPASTTGNGVVMVPVVSTNAVFRVAVSGVAVSPEVPVTVVPSVSLALQAGRGRTDVLMVSAPDAQSGDVVVLQASAGGGAWTNLRQGTLTMLRRASFPLTGMRQGRDEVRAVLEPTALHAGSVSAPVTVSPG
jgi:hypothetical protein